MATPDLAVRWRQEGAIAASLQGSSPAVGDEHVYVGDMDGEFYALSRTDGSVVWSRTREGALTDSSAWYHDGRVYVGSGGGAVYAFDADGTRCWRSAGESAVSVAPVVADGTVFVGCNDGSVLALAEADGTVRWQTTAETSICSGLGYSARVDAVYATTNSGAIYALDAATGKPLWSQQFGADVDVSAPAVDEDRGLVYFAASEVMALDADSGASVWGTSFYGANAGAAPIFDETNVYVGGADGSVYAISRPTGPLASAADWAFQSWDVSIVGTPAFADDRLVVVSLDGTLYVLETDTGKGVARAELSSEVRSAPVVTDGAMFVCGADGTVYAFEYD